VKRTKYGIKSTSSWMLSAILTRLALKGSGLAARLHDSEFPLKPVPPHDTLRHRVTITTDSGPAYSKSPLRLSRAGSSKPGKSTCMELHSKQKIEAGRISVTSLAIWRYGDEQSVQSHHSISWKWIWICQMKSRTTPPSWSWSCLPLT